MSYLLSVIIKTKVLFPNEKPKPLERRKIFKRKNFINKLSKKQNYGNTISFDNGKESN